MQNWICVTSIFPLCLMLPLCNLLSARSRMSRSTEQRLPCLQRYMCSRLTWPGPIPHWGKGSGTWPQSNLLPRNLISHANPVVMSAMAITKVRLVTFLHSWFRYLLCCNTWLKTLLAQCASHASSSLSTQTEIWIFPVITYFRYHVTEYCAVIGTRSTVRGNKLLYGHVPDPFPRCGIGSGHVRLQVQLLLTKSFPTYQIVFF